MDRQSKKLGNLTLHEHRRASIWFINVLCLVTRSSLNQLTAFQQARPQNNYLQSTTLTTTSGLGASNYTSYTNDPIDSSLNSLGNDNKQGNFNAVPGASSSFMESDSALTDEYLYVREGEHPRFMSPQKIKFEPAGYNGRILTVVTWPQVWLVSPF